MTAPALPVPGPVEENLLDTIAARGGCLAVLVDPDRSTPEDIGAIAAEAAAGDADLILVGSSLMLGDGFEPAVRAARSGGDLPVVVFPGGSGQVTGEADALLFLTLLSGRNPEYLIGQHVAAAPRIHSLGIETIPTAYLLVESGPITSVQYMSMTQPLPRSKPDLAVAHALAARYLGLRFIYLDSGSGAAAQVPEEMISAVAESARLPLIVGGGIREPAAARTRVEAGASVIVVGSALEGDRDPGLLAEMADAAHLRGAGQSV
jgi:putative glycerol-1-phosphate prenyltransferase